MGALEFHVELLFLVQKDSDHQMEVPVRSDHRDDVEFI